MYSFLHETKAKTSGPWARPLETGLGAAVTRDLGLEFASSAYCPKSWNLKSWNESRSRHYRANKQTRLVCLRGRDGDGWWALTRSHGGYRDSAAWWEVYAWIVLQLMDERWSSALNTASSQLRGIFNTSYQLSRAVILTFYRCAACRKPISVCTTPSVGVRASSQLENGKPQ